MHGLWKFESRITSEMIARMVADAVIVNAAVTIGISARFVLSAAINNRMPEDYHLSFLIDSLQAYAASGFWLTLVCLGVFWVSGFYSYGRAYQSRYKALIIAQSVSIAFLSFAALSYLIPLFHPFPRSVFLSGWVLTLGFTEAARLWSYIWRRAAKLKTTSDTTDGKAIRRVLVIGGAGYIGSVLVRKLLDRQYDVVVLDTLLYGDEGIRDLRQMPNFHFINGDLRDVEAIVSASKGADAVVHLGAIVGDPACAIDENLTLQINLAATRVIAEVAKGFGVRRFIFASTCSVYGASEEVLDEKSDLKPVSLYARSKIASENAILALDDARFSPTVVRFATIFGMSPRPRFDLVVNVLSARAVVEGSITISGGDQWRPFIHVSDAAEALCRCLEAPELVVKGEIFNVGSDRENYRIAQIGEMVASAVPGVRVITDEQNTDQRNYRVSFDKFRQKIGFVPSLTVPSGISEIVQAVRDGLIPDYRSSKYSNHKTLFEDGVAVRIQRDEAWMSLYPVTVVGDADRHNGRDDRKILVIDEHELTLVLQSRLEQRGDKLSAARSRSVSATTFEPALAESSLVRRESGASAPLDSSI